MLPPLEAGTGAVRSWLEKGRSHCTLHSKKEESKTGGRRWARRKGNLK